MLLVHYLQCWHPNSFLASLFLLNQCLYLSLDLRCDANELNIDVSGELTKYELCHEKIDFLYMGKQRCRSAVVTAQLISAFVFATSIVQSLYFLNLKSQASSHLLWVYSPICVRPGRKPEDRFSHDAAHIFPLSSNTHLYQFFCMLQVSATYAEGYRLTAVACVGGPRSKDKALRTADEIVKR